MAKIKVEVEEKVFDILKSKNVYPADVIKALQEVADELTAASLEVILSGNNLPADS